MNTKRQIVFILCVIFFALHNHAIFDPYLIYQAHFMPSGRNFCIVYMSVVYMSVEVKVEVI
jgi:hypothetical protein